MHQEEQSISAYYNAKLSLSEEIDLYHTCSIIDPINAAFRQYLKEHCVFKHLVKLNPVVVEVLDDRVLPLMTEIVYDVIIMVVLVILEQLVGISMVVP